MRRSFAGGVIRRSGVARVVRRAFGWSGVLVLTYHRIGNGRTSPFDRGLWSADVDAFGDQIRFCKSHLEVITPKDLPQVISGRKGRYALISFDDGYRDNYQFAFPILKAESVPATFFVASGFLDAPRLAWWDEIAWMVRTSRRQSVLLRGWLAAPVQLDEPDREQAVRVFLRACKAAPADATSDYLDAVAEATGSGRARSTRTVCG